MTTPGHPVDTTAGDFPLLHAAKTAIRGHAAIAERIAEHRAQIEQERLRRARALASTPDAASPPAGTT